MGAVFTNLTQEELCDLMCGAPEEEEKDIEEYIIRHDKADDTTNSPT